MITKPRNYNKKLVATIWQEALSIDSIDITSNFFKMGGHSIMAVKIMIRIEKETTKKIPLSALFQNATVEKFAKLLHADIEIDSDCLVPLKPNGSKAPLFIIHGAGLNVLNFIDLSKHFDEDQPIYGLQGTAKKYDDWYESIEAMAGHYIESIVKIYPEGPYALAGFSFGGVVAFEMTRQLKEQGRKVILTALLDTYVDTSYYYKTYRQKKLVQYCNLTRRRLDFLKEIVTSWKSLKLRTNGKKEYLLKKYFGQDNTMTEMETLALEQFTEANHMVNIIVDRYHLKPQNFVIDLFRSKDDMEYKLDPQYMGWKKATLQDIIIHNISGNHLDIVAPPHDKVLAGLLQDILNKKHKIS
ncbi:thioesterase domain-containing protein [Flavobacterium sp. Arc3]|jgi:thioesterase domain-containing protein/acyl carrier protein|uniref:thioesterase domain-containing protein n=1 Tax=unclassified Flavobacterium TaxID=196869 RepID=UPI00352F537A